MAERNGASLIERMPRDTRLWRWLFFALSAFPWLWLLQMALFTLAVSIQQGQLPSYGQPDPKDTGLLVSLYWPTVLLSVPTLLTVPIWLIIALTGRLDLIPLRAERRIALLYITGLVLAAVIIVGDAGGLMTWLVD